MGRPKTIHVDELTLLAAIERDDQEQRAAIEEAQQANLRYTNVEWHDHLTIGHGPVIDYARWLGREPSPSERLRHQQALRQMEHRGLVRIYGDRATRAQLTEAGRAWLAQQQQPAEPPTDG